MNHPVVYSLLWHLMSADNCLHAASCCASEQRAVKFFWSDDATLIWDRRRQLTKLIAREKRLRARAALAYMLIALVMIKTRCGFIT